MGSIGMRTPPLLFGNEWFEAIATYTGRVQSDTYGLWVDVLASLTLAAEVSTQPETNAHLRRCGVRVSRTLAQNLARELEQFYRITGWIGVVVPESVLQEKRDALANGDGVLDRVLEDLARAYLRLMTGPVVAKGSPLDSWFQSRAMVHMAQVDAIRRGV